MNFGKIYPNTATTTNCAEKIDHHFDIMIIFINRLIYIFRGPPISLASITRIKPHHVRCAQGNSVHYNMLAKILKKENENFSKQNFISKFQLLSDKIVLTSPPPVSGRSSV